MGKHDETSIWKKEISFRRKPKQAPKAEPVWPQEAAHAASAAAGREDLGLEEGDRLRPQGQAEAAEARLAAARRGAAPAAGAAAAEPDAKGSVWKKEISFGRKAKPEASAAERPRSP